NGGVLGVRVRENLAEHFGLEQSFAFLGNNNAPIAGTLLGTRLRQVYLNANLIGYDSESRVRPYFSTGVGWSFFRPTDEAKSQNAAALGTILGVGSFSAGNDSPFHYNVGGGLKFKLSDRFGLDFSARDFIYKTPDFNFPSPSDKDFVHNLQ